MDNFKEQKKTFVPRFFLFFMSASIFASFVAVAASFVSLYFVIIIRDNNAQTNLINLDGTLKFLQQSVDQTQLQTLGLDLSVLITKNQTYTDCLTNTSTACSQLTRSIQQVQGNLTSVKTIQNINTLYITTNTSCSTGILTLQTKIATVSANSTTNQVVQQGTFQVSLDGLYNTTSSYLIQRLNMNTFSLFYNIYKSGWSLLGLPGMYTPGVLVFSEFNPTISGCNNYTVSLGKRTLLEFQSFGGLFGSVERFCDNDRLVFYGTGISLNGTVLSQSQDIVNL